MYTVKDEFLCVPARALIFDLCLITESNFKQLVHRKKIIKVQSGGNGRQALVEFKSLPADIKKAVIAKIGKPTEEDKKSRIEFFYKEDIKARAYYESYRLPDGRNLKDIHVDEYTANASMLSAIELAVNETIMERSARGGSKKVNWTAIAKTVSLLKNKKGDEGTYLYPHTLPENERRLREKLNDMKNKGYEGLIRTGKYQNKNASKITLEEQEAMLQEILANGRNLDNVTISTMYNAFAKRAGWEEITPSAVGQWRKKLKRITEPGRRGVKNYENTISMQVKRSAPSAPLFYWTADGWKAELLYQKRKKNAQGHWVTDYHYRLTVVIILDAYNKYPVGYAIGENESPDLIKNSLRNAVNHTKELFGKRYRTWQIQSDNYQHSNLSSYWEAIGDSWTPAKVGNAKSKIIEPWFKDLNRRCQLEQNWAGHNITASPDKQVNDEWLNMHKKSFPDQEGCLEQIARIIESVRAEKREEFVNAFLSLDEKDKLPMPEDIYLYKFGEKTAPNRLEGQGLTPRIGGKEHYYDCFDLSFRDHLHERWVVHYDPEDTRKALAVSKNNEQLRFMVEEKYIQPMALKDRKDGDFEELERIREFNRRDKELITEKRKKGAEIIQEFMLENKELEEGGILSKILITDSKGQHKDKRFQREASDTDFEEHSKKEQANDYLKNKVNINDYM